MSTLQRLVVGQEQPLARTAQHVAARRLTPAARRERQRFASAMGEAAGSRMITLGRWKDASDVHRWVGVSPEKLFGQHAWVTGATGSGKTFFVLGMLLQVLRRSRDAVVVVDLKGELSQLLRETVLPALAIAPGGESLIDQLRIIRPFDQGYLPQLRITAPEENVSREIQAHAIASSLEDALGGPLGARMNRIFLKLTSLAIERGRPLPDVLRWLENPALLVRDGRDSSDLALRAYAIQGLGKENRQTQEALLARLDTFFLLPETRLALSAPTCVSFQECLDSGLTVIDVGDPPAGAERVARFWAAVLGGRLTRAILSRRVTERSRRAWIIWEEFQEALGSSQTEQFGRLLALARYKKVALWFVNQQPGQVAAREPALVKTLRTNTGLEAAFRCNLEDARALTHALPLPQGESATEARQRVTEELTRLPDRAYLLWLKQAPFRAQQVRSPRLDLEGLKTAAGRCPVEMRARIERGTVSVARSELEDAVTADTEGPETSRAQILDFGIPGSDPPRASEADEPTNVPFLG